jgi:hypothetical protein
MCSFFWTKPKPRRYIAFPASWARVPMHLQLFDKDFDNDMRIISGPSDSGLYLIEATDTAIDRLRQLYAGRYILMEDFLPPDK